jgi:acyl phosphate:glycerol-3-phosphate acyltransferase
MDTALAIAASYLLGAIPFGLIVARLHGIDIRAVGSGNIGATNVFRAVGRAWGIFTLLCDALKGLVPVMLLARLAGPDAPAWLPLACGCMAIAGHNWPIYIGFKGGKGVATAAGALIGIAPAPLGIGLLSFAACFAFSRYVSLGSVAAAVAIPVSAWLLVAPDDPRLTPTVLTILGVLIVVKHRTNIKRLIAGTEHRIAFGKQP